MSLGRQNSITVIGGDKHKYRSTMENIPIKRKMKLCPESSSIRKKPSFLEVSSGDEEDRRYSSANEEEDDFEEEEEEGEESDVAVKKTAAVQHFEEATTTTTTTAKNKRATGGAQKKQAVIKKKPTLKQKNAQQEMRQKLQVIEKCVDFLKQLNQEGFDIPTNTISFKI